MSIPNFPLCHSVSRYFLSCISQDTLSSSGRKKKHPAHLHVLSWVMRPQMITQVFCLDFKPRSPFSHLVHYPSQGIFCFSGILTLEISTCLVTLPHLPRHTGLISYASPPTVVLTRGVNAGYGVWKNGCGCIRMRKKDKARVQFQIRFCYKHDYPLRSLVLQYSYNVFPDIWQTHVSSFTILLPRVREYS